MRGHEEASGIKYVPKELTEQWAAKDPIKNFQKYLLDKKLITLDEILTIKKGISNEIDVNWKKAVKEEAIVSSTSNELSDVFQPFDYQQINPSDKKSKIRLVDAISNSLRQSMEKYGSMVIMGHLLPR